MICQLFFEIFNDISRYCSHGYVPRGVFVRFLRENPELHGAKLRFIQFLCITKRVIVFSMPLLAWCEQ